MRLNRSTMYYFIFNNPSPTEIYTLSLHDALPILAKANSENVTPATPAPTRLLYRSDPISCHVAPFFMRRNIARSEEHTSELQSRPHLVCRLLLEKKKISWNSINMIIISAHEHTST